MDRSAYLAQALQSMGQPQSPSSQGLSPQQMQHIADARKAFEAQNPGQSYMAHGLQQMGQDIMNAPQNAAQGLGRLAASLGIGGGATPAGPQPLPNATMDPSAQAVTISPLHNPRLTPDGTPVIPGILPNARFVQ